MGGASSTTVQASSLATTLIPSKNLPAENTVSELGPGSTTAAPPKGCPMHEAGAKSETLDLKKMAKTGQIPSGCPMHRKEGSEVSSAAGGGDWVSECPMTGATSSTLMTDSRTDDIDPQNMVSHSSVQ